MGYWSSLYSRFDILMNRIPTIDPNKISYFSVVLSMPFVYLYPSCKAIFVLMIVVFLDYLDGVMARRLRKCDEHVDLACDRVSELLIAYKLGSIFILAAVVNVWLSVYKLKNKNKNIPLIIPLRHLILLFIVYECFLA